MNKIVYFLLVLAVIACGNKTTGKVNAADSAKENDKTVAEADDDYVPQRSDYSFRSEVRTIKDDDEVRWDSIIVYLTDAKGHTLELYSQAMPLDTMNWQKGSIGEIEEEDRNFDDHMQASVSARLRILDVVFLRDQCDVVLCQKSTCQVIDIVREGTDHADAGDVVDALSDCGEVQRYVLLFHLAKKAVH